MPGWPWGLAFLSVLSQSTGEKVTTAIWALHLTEPELISHMTGSPVRLNGQRSGALPSGKTKQHRRNV